MRVLSSLSLVKAMARSQDSLVATVVAVFRRHEVQRGVQMLRVVPAHEVADPFACFLNIMEARFGNPGLYFRVRKSASEYGLSSLTRGLLKGATTPSRCSVASIVAPFIGPPLSE